MLIENMFNLAQFDPVATDFDLMIVTAEEIDVAVCPITGPVSQFCEALNEDRSLERSVEQIAQMVRSSRFALPHALVRHHR